MKIVSKSLKKLDEPVPVYDLTSNKNKNFVLANGCVVHNSAKKARDSSFQEVLKLKGKPINALRKPVEQVLSNEAFQNLIIALDIDTETSKKGKHIFSAENLRVNNTYLLADADADGPLHGDTEIIQTDGSSIKIRNYYENYSDKIGVYGYAGGLIHSSVEASAFYPKIYDKVTEATEITTLHGSVICTHYHKWLSATTGQYVKASDLKIGDRIVSMNGSEKIIIINTVQFKNPEPMYCLTVPQTGNFFVKVGEHGSLCSANCHINLLILSFFYRFMPDYIKQGRLRIVDAPLYFGFFKNKRYMGSTFQACYKQMPKDAPKHSVIRAKGWGESLSLNTLLHTNIGLVSYNEMCSMNLADGNIGINKTKVKLCSASSIRKSESVKVSKRQQGLFKITTLSGCEIIQTDEHTTPVMSDGLYVEKKTVDIKVGDHCMLSRGLMVFGKKSVDPRIAHIMGASIADGTYRIKGNNNILRIYDDHIAPIHLEFMSIINELKCDYRLTKRKGKTTDLASVCFRVNNKHIYSVFDECGYKTDWTSHTKQVPLGIRMGDYETVKAFLYAYLNRDGAIDSACNRFEVTSVSKKLLQQVKMLLANFGIIASVRSRGNGSYKPDTSIWRLRFSGAKNMWLFREHVGVSCPKLKKSLNEYLKNNQYNSNNDIIPGIRKHYTGKGKIVSKVTNIHKLTPAANFTNEYFEKHVIGTFENSIAAVKDTLTFVQNNLHKVYYDPIVSIKQIKRKKPLKVVDFRFGDSDRLFIASGMLTHNCDPEALSTVAFHPDTRSYIVVDYCKTKELLERYESIVGSDSLLRKEILGL